MKINWIGCKKKMLPQIIDHMPSKFNTYYEPFLGSGALYFHLKPEKAILNDNDSHLITMWQQSFQNPQDFVNKVKTTEEFIYHHQNQQDQKLAYKTLLNEYNKNKLPKLTRSAIFFVINKYAFRGITRYNKQNHLMVGFGYKPKQKMPIIDLKELIKYANNFNKNNHILQCTDFHKVIINSQKGDFLFIDPPYYYDGIKDKDFYFAPFTFNDHQQLADTLHQATNRGVKWLYTNYATDTICNLFQNSNVIKIKITTTPNLTNKKIKQEMIIKNY